MLITCFIARKLDPQSSDRVIRNVITLKWLDIILLLNHKRVKCFLKYKSILLSLLSIFSLIHFFNMMSSALLKYNLSSISNREIYPAES